jgi:uncharacterized protein
MNPPLRNLIITGGVHHPFEAASRTLAELLGEVGFTCEITTDAQSALASLSEGRFDLLTVYTLRWPMREARYDADRPRWGMEIGASEKAAIEQHLAAGRGVLALHTAAICFGDWPRWREIVGAAWAWGQSSHPPHGPLSVRMTSAPHPITQGLSDFEVADEAYSNMDYVPGIEALATVRAPSQDREWPCLWARTVGTARVAYDALGHDSASFSHPTHRRIVQRAARWCTRQEQYPSKSEERTE